MTTAMPLAVEVGALDSALHDPGYARPCVHALTTPPDRMLVSRKAMAKLNFQSRVIQHNPPCIAARVRSTLIVGFDEIGPLRGCRHRSKEDRVKLRHRFEYTLSQIDYGSDILLATRIK